MHRRWLGLIALLVSLGWARQAHATLGFDPLTPVVFTAVQAGPTAFATATRTISSDAAPEMFDTFSTSGAGCTAYTITPSKTLPQNITGGNTVDLKIDFRPLGRGSYQCTVTLKTGAAPNGVFVINGTAVAPVISTSPATTATFTDVRVANGVVQSSTRTIRITNATPDAAQNLTISMLGFGGANPGEYSITSTPAIPASIPPGGFIDVTLTFNPSTPGAKPATFVITSDDPATPSKVITLNGSGTNAVIATGDAAFGIVAGGSFGSRNVNVTNTAAAPVGTLTLLSASIVPATGWFTFDANGNGCSGMTSCTFASTVAPASIAVRCSPPFGASGTQNATVTVMSDTDGGGDSLGMLSCTAGRPDITVTPATMAFGNQPANTTSTAMQIVVQNTGNTVLTYQIAASGGTPAAFPLSPACPGSGCTLGAGLMAMHNVTFSPTTNTMLGTTFNVTSDDPDLADQLKTVVVSGTGTAPQIAVPSSLDFSTLEIPDTSSLVITAMNTGNSPLNITSSTITSGASDYTITAGGTGMQTVTNPGSTSWTIRCNPSTTGARPGNFRIVSNSLIGATTDVALTCTGLQGSLATTPATAAGAPLDFGGVTIGSTSTLSFTLQNPGNVTVTGITGVLAPANVGYSIDPATPIPTTLLAGQTVSINVKFSPTATMDGGPATIMFTGNWGTMGKTAAVTLFIGGDGLTVGYDVVTIPTSSPPTLDFGMFRWDTTATATFCIVNTDQATITIQDVVATPTAPTIASELQITAIRRSATCAVTANPTVVMPQPLTAGQFLVVTVVADPNARTGLLEGIVTVTSPTLPMRTVALTGMSTTAMLTTTPSLSVDFGNVDRDGPPAMRTVTITNTGAADLNLSAFARNPVGGPFAFTLPANQVVIPGGHLDVVVTYTPTVEHATNAFDQVVLSHNIAGVLGGPASQMITLRGRGIDRHISLAAPPVFPETFRNPGSKAPEMPVTVTNTGEATLSISAVMVTNSDVWHVVDPNPVNIPSKGSHDFLVRFEPKIMGAAPVGRLVFMNNDNSLPAPIAAMNLTGNGLDRRVVMTDPAGMPTIDLGLTAIGIPVTLPDGLHVVNQDGMHDFEIREVVFDDSLFSIASAPAGVNLSAGTTQTYSVVFTPTDEGPFETTANLFLDEDPTVTTTVKVKGQAVFVDVTGGGGCSTGGGGTGAGALIVIGALALRRRRRMAAAVVALGLALIAWPAVSRADSELDLSLFSPTPSTTGTGFQVQPASVGDNGAFAAAATVSYATNPLVLKFSGNEHMAITQRTTMELGLAYAFLGTFEAGARMPLYNQSGDGAMVGVVSPSGTARGDLVLHGKAQLARVAAGGGQVFVGATLSLTLPTATSAEFAGVSKPTGRIYGLLTVLPGALSKRISLSANLGAVIREKASLSNIDQGSGLAWGVGGSIRLLDQLWATGEMFGDVMPAGRKSSVKASSGVLAPSELLVGFTYRPDRRVSLGIAAGRGLIAGIGTPDVRGVFSLSYVPGTAELPPIHPPPPPKIDGDADGDGIKDSVDRCPEEAEDKDMFDDTDGCPDLDNDGDGVEDSKDMCPLDAEDKDGFQDDDGCPDKDNDNDGIPDAQDKCPNTPEDKDGYLDVDGCPDPDNDSDGILDGQDMCPNEPETINGNTDDDGCPDRGDALVVVTPAGVEITEAIQFTGTKVAKASTNVLNQVAATLRAHQEIVRVKLVVHVQPTGDSDKDQELSDKRAQAVRDWLVQWGIPQARLSAQGMGGSRPLVPRTAKQAQVINERVEMIILERK